ncbi:CHAP domain-containing protein [Candidatus Berkelbacteria bacterium]|nr:CHAP domain-containing protein [Candidatus Berkelbacteria bacterium]
MNMFLVPDQDEPPLIRLKTSLNGHFGAFKRAMWVRAKLAKTHVRKLPSLALIGLILFTPNPYSSVQAADAAGSVSNDKAQLASIDFAELNKATAARKQTGVATKPLITTTDIGTPEKELIAEQERLAELQRQNAAARARAIALARARASQATEPTSTTDHPVEPAATSQEIDRTPQGGNTYPYGYCTWWSKQKRPDLPNALGNAINWYNGAAARGYAVGRTPQVGSILVTRESGYGHVGYVIAVDGDTVTTSDMNFNGWGIVSTRQINNNSGLIVGYIY